jgi:hypothetical protein
VGTAPLTYGSKVKDWHNNLLEVVVVCTVIKMVSRSVSYRIVTTASGLTNKPWFHENLRLIKDLAILTS